MAEEKTSIDNDFHDPDDLLRSKARACSSEKNQENKIENTIEEHTWEIKKVFSRTKDNWDSL